MKITINIPNSKLIGLKAIEKALKLSRMRIKHDQLLAAQDIICIINNEIDSDNLVKYVK